MRAVDWKDAVDFGYWIFSKIHCHKCNKVVSYSCHSNREMSEDCLRSPVKFWCEDCLIKELHLSGPEDIEKACEGPKRVYAVYEQKGICEHGNEKSRCGICTNIHFNLIESITKGVRYRRKHKNWWKFWK